MAINIIRINLNGTVYGVPDNDAKEYSEGNGVPTHISRIGSVYVDLDSGISYLNKNGDSQWAIILDSINFTGGTSGGTGVSISAFTYDNANTLTITDASGGTFSTTIDTMTGLTVNGSVTATTFYGDGSNLSGISTTDIYVTGGTYSNGTAIFTNNTGGAFNVTSFFTGNTDVYTTGATYSDNTFTYTNNTGGTFNVLFNSVTGLTVNGSLSGTSMSATTLSSGDSSTSVATTAFVNSLIGNTNQYNTINNNSTSSYVVSNNNFGTIQIDYIAFSSSTSTYVNIPSDSILTNVGNGKAIVIEQVGAGQITFSAGTSVTFRSADSAYTSRTQFSKMWAIKVSDNTWSIGGDTL